MPAWDWQALRCSGCPAGSVCPAPSPWSRQSCLDPVRPHVQPTGLPLEQPQPREPGCSACCEMSVFSFGQCVEVEIKLSDAWEGRQRAGHKTEDRKQEAGKVCPLLQWRESLLESGPCTQAPQQTAGASRSSSSGGSNYYYCGKHHEFVSLVKDLAWPEEITQSQAFCFQVTYVETRRSPTPGRM